MDTEWFAVDRCGHVALFSCGGSGKLPRAAATRGGDAELSEMIFGSPASTGDPDPAGAGLFHYRHTRDEAGGGYLRDSSPVKPILLDDLPERAEAKLQGFRLESLCFLEATAIRPEDHAACIAPPPAPGRGWLSRWFGGNS